jgi:hypothetical protein
MLSAARCRARERGLAFDLTATDLEELWAEQDGRCFWFNVPMVWREDVGPMNPMIPTIDRVDSSRGYVRSNVVLACWGANAAKGACEPDVWEEFLDFLRAGLVTGLTSGKSCVDRTSADDADTESNR